MNCCRVAFRMTKFRRTATWLAAIAACVSAVASEPPLGSESVYTAKDTLSETLSASRQRLRHWQQRQQDALGAIRMDPWHSTTASAAEQAPLAVDSASVDLTARNSAGQPVWVVAPRLDGRAGVSARRTASAVG